MIDSVDLKTLRNNTQRVLVRLLRNDDWTSVAELRVENATSRIRDLRKEEFGGFDVEVARAGDVGRRGNRNTFVYRVRNATRERVRRVLGE